jgi:carbon-monoxide dehydrogenase large subunit
LAQIAADALEMPIERIRVHHGSTDHLAEGFGTYSSRSTVMGGSAVIAAAGKLRRAIRAAAARHLGCEPDEVEIAEGMARGKGAAAGLSLGALAGEGIAADGSYASTKRTYSYGAHAAHVAVDPKTGHVAVIDYVAVEDVGRIVNPAMLHGQAVGAVVQGLGGTLLEHLVHDEQAQLLTGSLADYLLPTASDFPAVRAVALEEKPAPNPLGAKGAGEGGIIPVGGVIANAVAAALRPLGVEPRELPLSPSKLWALIAEKEPSDACAERARRPYEN